MRDNGYQLRILPIFEQDLNQIVDYITQTLSSPDAAIRLVDEVQLAIAERVSHPTIFEPFRSAHQRKYPYYVIRVRNYSIFYVVIDQVMEVRRILYSKRDFNHLIP